MESLHLAGALMENILVVVFCYLSHLNFNGMILSMKCSNIAPSINENILFCLPMS